MKKLKKYLEDILIISGLLVIAGTTFFIDIRAGSYVLGVELILMGIIFAKFTVRR